MVQIPLRRAHRLRAIILASPTKKRRPHSTERTPTAWHTNDEYTNAEASEEANASSAVANVSKNRILPIPTPARHWLHQSCSYKRVSSVGPFYDGLTAARWRAERFLGPLAARGSGCVLKTSRVSCCLITLSSSSAPASLSSSIIPISGRIYSWVSSRSCSGVWARTERVVAERRRLVMISPPLHTETGPHNLLPNCLGRCSLCAPCLSSCMSAQRDEERRIDGQRTGTARPFPLWRLPSGPYSPPIDPIFESGIAPRPE